MTEKTINRARTYSDLMRQSTEGFDFKGDWLKSFGRPELTGSWLIWGNPGNGKTRFALQLCKYLASFCRVAYNSLEESDSMSIRNAIKEVGMSDVRCNFILLDQ